MDASASNNTRKFPAYTTAELEASVARLRAGQNISAMPAEAIPAHIAALEAEIAARKAGTSKPRYTPQVR